MSYSDAVCKDCHGTKYIKGKFCKECVQKRVDGYDNLKEIEERLKNRLEVKKTARNVVKLANPSNVVALKEYDKFIEEFEEILEASD